jgi:hypothetical protein
MVIDGREMEPFIISTRRRSTSSDSVAGLKRHLPGSNPLRFAHRKIWSSRLRSSRCHPPLFYGLGPPASRWMQFLSRVPSADAALTVRSHFRRWILHFFGTLARRRSASGEERNLRICRLADRGAVRRLQFLTPGALRPLRQSLLRRRSWVGGSRA